MIRKTVRLEQRHANLLKCLARERGVTESQIVREAIAGMENIPFRPDPEALRKFFTFIREIEQGRRRPLPRWNRESLYEERNGR
jgi:hypothetical protein